MRSLQCDSLVSDNSFNKSSDDSQRVKYNPERIQLGWYRVHVDPDRISAFVWTYLRPGGQEGGSFMIRTSTFDDTAFSWCCTAVCLSFHWDHCFAARPRSASFFFFCLSVSNLPNSEYYHVRFPSLRNSPLLILSGSLPLVLLLG